MPSKRVSMKGKGSALFFGDAPEPVQAPGADMPAATTPESDSLTESTGTPRDMSPASPRAAPAPDAEVVESAAPSPRPARRTGSAAQSKRDTTAARSAARAADSERASSHARTAANPSAALDEATIEAIRKTVKDSGKEIAYARVTPEEKALLTDIVYTFKRQGHKTSENEIQRIALCYLLQDYHDHGENSVLVRVLASLRA